MKIPGQFSAQINIREPLQRALGRIGPVEDVACDNKNVWLMIVDYRQDLHEGVIMVVLQRHPMELAPQMPVTCVQNAHSAEPRISIRIKFI